MFSPFSCVWLCVTPWLVAHQASLSMGFSRLEYWSGLPFPPPQDLKWGKISNVLKGKYFTKCNLGASLVVQWLRIRLVMQGTPIWSLVMVDTRRRQWHPTPVLLPGKSHGRRTLVGYSPRGCKELDMTEQLNFCLTKWNCIIIPPGIFTTGYKMFDD